ncbi:MAG: hypothetical protein E7226_05945 [Clostridiales bacterium]|nr:hypothetical protein [Clostridiales bacterium]
MNIKEFTARAAEEVLEYLPDDLRERVSVEETEVMKVNDQILHGLAFHRGDEPAPTFYLDDLFKLFQDGACIGDLLRGMAEAYTESYATADFGTGACPEADSGVPFPVEIPDLSYRNVIRKVGVRLLGKDFNNQFLKIVPFRDVGNGYALIADAQIGASDGGVFSTVITNKMAEEYAYDMDVIFDRALDNAWRTNAAVFMPAEEVMSGGDWPEGEASCWLLTTNRPRCGAAALFYPGTQTMIADVLDEDYFAIPSSLHEFIIVRAGVVGDPAHLCRLVREANRTIVCPEDLLSDNLLYYSKSTGALSLVLPEEDDADFAG